jgi:DNA-binding beta-propeller fold protein YncE
VCYFGLTCLLLSALMLTGCASEQRCKYVPSKQIFFPPAPDDPHIQFLTGINSSEDIGVLKKQGSLSLVVTGKERPDIIKKLGKAYGIAVYKGKIYLAEGMGRRISIVDPVNGTIDELEGTKDSKGALSYPVNLAFDDDGNLYVVDTGRKEIVVYDRFGNFKTSFGKKDKGKITDVKIYKGKLYALDMNNNVVRVLDRTTGEQIDEIGKSENPAQRLALPGNFTMDTDGNLYIANIASNKVVKMDLDGNYIGSFGGVGDRMGEFAKPKGITLDSNKYIYVVDGGTNLVQMFNDKFNLLTFFGWPGLEFGSLNGPAGIVTSTENLDYFKKYAAPGFKLETLIYVVSQFGQEFCIPRVSVYGLGQMEKK